MSPVEVVIWSMATGAIGTVVLLGLAEVAFGRTVAGLQGTAYHALALLFVFLLSGLPREIWPGLDERWLRVMQVMIGPICNTLGNYWVRGWLGAHYRDSLMEAGLRWAGWVSPFAGLACLLLPWPQQLPAAGAICLLNAALLFWLTTRGFLLGDRMAAGMVVGSGFALPAILGLYGVALRLWELPIGVQVLIALCAVLCTCCVSVMVWLRAHPHVLSRPDPESSLRHDPVTKLYSGIALVQKMIKAQRRRRRTRRDGAIVAVIVFDLDRIAEQLGPNGLNELFIAVGNRIQRQVGVVNPVGRYWDRCFVSLVETIPSPSWLRTLGLRVSSNLRRPIEVSGPNGTRVSVRPDIGVGVVHLLPGHTAVEDILHDAQRLAEAARGMRSRAATLDLATGEVVAVEEANLGPRRRGQANHVPHSTPARGAAV
ncbi:diguanylate cyclase domain-containing protein [Ramlibacter albus]|uniref:Diguanylate cyclase n=1 Tax=Ramlibacter albus TaxID=2079448 RepID=A0A923S2I5_9BURK|nr:diguanylate cyclase [Ramlibacter albus]MBC5764798.1 diguanylate cyclase [Ramlibacter albus]